MSKEKIVFVRETTFESYLADFFTFASIVGSFWFNYTYIGGNDALDILLFICFFLFALGRAKDLVRLRNDLEDKDKK